MAVGRNVLSRLYVRFDTAFWRTYDLPMKLMDAFETAPQSMFCNSTACQHMIYDFMFWKYCFQSEASSFQELVNIVGSLIGSELFRLVSSYSFVNNWQRTTQLRSVCNARLPFLSEVAHNWSSGESVVFLNNKWFDGTSVLCRQRDNVFPKLSVLAGSCLYVETV